MKLIRWGERGAERPGLIDGEGRARDLSDHLGDLAGDALAPAALANLGRIDAAGLPPVPDGARLGVPVGGIGKIVCIGLNYADHAEELGMALPHDPVVFLKATSALSGPHDPIVMPKGSDKTDWEVELVIVIGAETKDVAEADAMEHVAGFCIGNDVSERAFQLERSGQWTKGKSSDTFCPLGPWLVTTDEIPNPQDLSIWLSVDGERMQDGSTRTMHFDVPRLVSDVSRYMSLQPGDVILTGTPPGVGMGKKPPRFLRAGNRLRLGITGLGEQEMDVVAAP